MPVHKCPNGKYRIGSGKCMYDSKEKAERAYKAYLVHKHMKEINDIKKEIALRKDELKEIREKLSDVNDKQ